MDDGHTEGDCHQNAGRWSLANPQCKVVHGWLVFDFEGSSGGLVPMVRFNAHSVIEDENGVRYDVTPSRASKRYPFLEHEGTREEFVRIVESNQLSSIDYNPLIDPVGK